MRFLRAGRAFAGSFSNSSAPRYLHCADLVRRLRFEPLEDRSLLSLAPLLVDLLPASDSGVNADDNLTNLRTPTVEITAAQPGEQIRVYRAGAYLGEAALVGGVLYQYAFTTGQLSEGANAITARAFDGSAESGDSPLLALALDTAGPRITASTPAAVFDLRGAALDSATVTYNEAIDFVSAGAGKFTTDDVALGGPSGAIPAAGIINVTGNQYQISFAAQTQRGTYRVQAGPLVTDLAGNPMDQDQDGTPGEAVQDVYQFSFDAYSADTIFTAPTLINAANTTYEGQDLCIDGATVTIDGSHNFASLQLIRAGVLTHSNGTGMNLNLGEMIVSASSSVNVNGKGYAAASGPGVGTSGPYTSGGAGYGGMGGQSSQQIAGGVAY
ncbi:MAG: Ig-like domain-containing protein, partial [Pirellulales bacterium]|nr:Ig-like domain-containing protein [Pirellulales bacterium]